MFDVVLYLGFVASMLTVMVMPGVPTESLSKVLPDNTSGLVNPSLVIVPMVLLVLVGLRDKTIFLAARSEQYLPALLFFATLGFTDMIVAAKLLIAVVWIGAGISKFGHHFSCVSQGRGLFSLLINQVPDIDRWSVREAEFACNSLIGFNFGDGHLHSEDLINAIQREIGFEPGEWIVVWVESQAIHSKVQHYKVIDAALGVIERGSWNVAEAVNEQPWLPNGPIPLNVMWRRQPEAPAGPAPATSAPAASAPAAGDDDQGVRINA